MNGETASNEAKPTKSTEAGNRDDHEISRDVFVRTVVGGGLAGDAMLQLVRAANSVPAKRASDNCLLCDFVSEVVAILRSPINPFEGMLEAPSPIVRLYQAHKDSMKQLRPHRDVPLEALLRDALAALYDGTGPIAWSTLEAAGAPEPLHRNTGGSTHDPDNW